MDEKNIKEILEIILDNLQDKEIIWRIEGSANLKIQGMEVSVNDLDITTNEEGIEIFRNALKKFIVNDFFNKKTNGFSLICDIGGFEVEINSYGNKELEMFDKTKIILWQNLQIPILPLEYAKKFYELINRKEKVELISEYLLRKERVMIFIDGSNLYYSLKDLKVDKINFRKFLQVLLKDNLLITTYYYNASLDISVNKKKYWEQQKFFDFLRKIPDFKVVLCRMRKHKKDGKFIFDVKGDDVHLAVDLVSGAYENLYDTAIIVSGDEDFVPAIQKVQKLGKRIINSYFKSTSSNYLKHTCDESFCMDKIIDEIKE